MESKARAVDVLCKDKGDCKRVIKMQIAREDGFETRPQYYAAKAFSKQAHKGDPYYGLKEVIF